MGATSEYDFDRHVAFAKSWEESGRKPLFRISDWNADPADVEVPAAIIRHAFEDALRNVTRYTETRLLIIASDEIRESLQCVYDVALDARDGVHLFGNATQALFATLGCLGHIVAEPRALVLTPSYYAVHETARFFRIPVCEVSRKMVDGFRIDIRRIDESRLRSKSNIIIVTLPVYSSGVCVPESQVADLVQYCKDRGIWLLVDNAFGGLSWTDDDKVWLDRTMMLRGAYDRAIVVDSPAKRLFTNNMKMALVFADRGLIKPLQEFSDHHIGNISWVQVAFARALFASANRPMLEHLCRTHVERAKKHFGELEGHLASSREVSLLRPDAGFHCVLRSSRMRIHEVGVNCVCEKLISDWGVFAMPVNDFMYDLDDYFGIRVNLMIPPGRSRSLFEHLAREGFPR